MTAFVYTAVAGCPHEPYLAYLRKWLPKAAALVKRPPGEVAISLVGATKMAALHEEFLGIAGPTDVLTFELNHDSRGRCIAGEVVVCVPFAQKEARRRGINIRLELLLYALHGLLHLSGYNDLTPGDFKKMHAEEDRILESIGVGAVFERRMRPS